MNEMKDYNFLPTIPTTGDQQGAVSDEVNWPEFIRRAQEAQQAQTIPHQHFPPLNPPATQPCPACGHCPACGRGGHYYQPYYYPQPYAPQITWTAGLTNEQGRPSNSA